MHGFTFHRRSLQYHKRSNLAVVLGIVVGSAALTGALLVGDSMRGSLRSVALDRLGRVDIVVKSTRFFRPELAKDIESDPRCTSLVESAVPVVVSTGGASHSQTRARANRITVYGIQDRFWSLSQSGTSPVPSFPSRRSVVLNTVLAEELGAKRGDDILLRVGKPSDVPSETLLGQREDTTATIRVTVSAIVDAKGVGAFGLSPKQGASKNAFVPMLAIQRSLDQEGRVNAVLIATESTNASTAIEKQSIIQSCVDGQFRLADLGLRLRLSKEHASIALESDTMLLVSAVEEAAIAAAQEHAMRPTRFLTYLANAIEIEDNGETRAIPYSTVTAINRDAPLLGLFFDVDGEQVPGPGAGDILLNTWAAADLSASIGDTISLEYFVTGEYAELETRRHSFVLRGIVDLDGRAADPGFTPEYKGVTDTENLAEWNPPFPMDLSVVRNQDEDYWDTYNATPKAFVSLEDGQHLWVEDAERYGALSAIYLSAADADMNLQELASRFESSFLSKMSPAQMGLQIDPLRENALQSSTGSTDFGMLFIGFSFFLIASAGMLVALLFRLGIERRASEVGLLLAIGYAPGRVLKMLLLQGAVLAVVGAAIGQLGALGYAWLMLAGLRSWWSGAVNSPFLTLFVSETTIAIGFSASVILSIASIAWSVRGMSHRPARSLLAGSVASGRELSHGQSGRWARRVATAAFLVAIILPLMKFGDIGMPDAILFFLSGAAILTGGLAVLAWRLGAGSNRIQKARRRASWTWLGLQNARRERRRSLLTAGLVSSACFLIVALEAFHLDSSSSGQGRASGTGGFSLYAESTAPLLFDLNTKEGRESLNVDEIAGAPLTDATFVPFRLRPGEESGCNNLYLPTQPRILGATTTMVERGGFAFSSTIADSQAEKDNPWHLLGREMSDGAIPVIGDEAAVLWQLHSGLGKDLVIQSESGEDVRLRFVALLSGSALQDELILSEDHFERLFPSVSGFGFFLIETPTEKSKEVEGALEEQLTPFGFDAGSTSERLAGYLVVQNTYLRTFQTLGGFGLILGTVGLAAVLLRNVLERRGELALMQAVGFSQRSLGLIVLSENVFLLVVGLLIGTVSALWAVMPHLLTRVGSIPWISLAATLAGVLVVGALAGWVALIVAFRSPLLPALRRE